MIRPAARTSVCRAGIAPVRLLALAAALAPSLTHAQVDNAKVDVTTYHNSPDRTGLNGNEQLLTPDLLRGRVPRQTFTRLWSLPLDGQAYAQPLVLTGVPVLVPGSGATRPVTKDLLIVATQNNSVYAFDAGQPGAYIWRWSGIIPNKLEPLPCDRWAQGKINLLDNYDIVPTVGITGTPVIDPETRRLYCVTKSLNLEVSPGDPQRYVQRIHKIDLTSGQEETSRVIAATCPGSGTGLDPDKPITPDQQRYAADGGYDPRQGTYLGTNVVKFLPKCQNQRPGLLLLNRVVYIGWSSHGDQGAYHGWLIGYDARTLEQVAVFNSTPNGYEGAIWQGGVAPAADKEGNIYLATGNGSFDAQSGSFGPNTNFGNSVLKLSTRDRSLRVVDYFSPFDRTCLNGSDLDLGSGGVMLLPEQPGSSRLLLSLVGKEGTIFLLDRENLGRSGRKDADMVVRRMSAVVGEKYGAGAYFNGSIYYGGGPFNNQASPLYRLSVPKALDQHRPDFDASTHRSDGSAVVFNAKGTNPSISSHGNANGILWTIRTDGINEDIQAQFDDPSKGRNVTSAILYAFDATSLELLWSSDDPKRGVGPLGDRIKFTVPTIANGKVYVATGLSTDRSKPGELNVLGVRAD
jgi:hypothetical protein